ncbi:hypothetical protein MNBD_ALPHA05-562, partial [hydrothermal vent metagenome]
MNRALKLTLCFLAPIVTGCTNSLDHMLRPPSMTAPGDVKAAAPTPSQARMNVPPSPLSH